MLAEAQVLTRPQFGIAADLALSQPPSSSEGQMLIWQMTPKRIAVSWRFRPAEIGSKQQPLPHFPVAMTCWETFKGHEALILIYAAAYGSVCAGA